MSGTVEDQDVCLVCLDGGHDSWGGPDFEVIHCEFCDEELGGDEVSVKYCCDHRYVGSRRLAVEVDQQYFDCMVCDRRRSECTCNDEDEDDES